MARDINVVAMNVRLTKDPELKYTPSNAAVCEISVANNNEYKTKEGEKKETVMFINCVAWGKTGETIAQYCKKGQQLSIIGRLDQQRWEDQEGKTRSKHIVTIDHFQFIGGKKESEQTGTAEPQAEYATDPILNAETYPAVPFSDEDIPF